MKKTYYYIGLVTIFSLLLMSFAWDNYGIWFDELFTLNLINNSYMDAIVLTAQDVHPPLYYILVKSFVELLKNFGISTVVATKLFSIIPLILLMGLSYPIINRRHGFKAALTFAVCLFGTRIIMYAVEIRMYSLAILCVTMAYLYAQEIQYNNTNRNWGLFVFYSVLGAYTHYYAVIAVSLAYFYLLANQLKQKNIKRWFIYFGLTVIIYLPWLLILMNQLAKVSEGWDFGFSLVEMAMLVVFPFFTNELITTILVIIFAGFIGISVLLKKDKNIDDRFSIICIYNPVYVLLIGVIIGLVTQKFFSGKYLLPGWGAFWLGITILISKSKNWKTYFSIILILNLTTFGISYNKENKDRKGFIELQKFIQENQDVNIYVTPILYNIFGYFELNDKMIEVEDFTNVQEGKVIYYTDYTDCKQCTVINTVLYGGASVVMGDLK